MTGDIVGQISEFLRQMREPGAATDPEFFEAKATLFSAIAERQYGRDPEVAAQVEQMAERARSWARELRRGRSS